MYRAKENDGKYWNAEAYAITCKLFASLEYAILTKAVVRGIDDDEEKAVNIFCDSDRAKTLLAWANQADPAAASQITVDSDPT